MFDSQLVITNIEEDVLASGVKNQRKILDECLEALESRDVTSAEVVEMLLLTEKNLRRLRTQYSQRYAQE